MTAIFTEKLLHAVDIPLRWGDIDAMGHLNNTVYFRLMEECRVQWLAQVQTELSPTSKVSAVIVNISAEFLKPLTYPSIVSVRMFARARRAQPQYLSYP